MHFHWPILRQKMGWMSFSLLFFPIHIRIYIEKCNRLLVALHAKRATILIHESTWAYSLCATWLWPTVHVAHTSISPHSLLLHGLFSILLSKKYSIFFILSPFQKTIAPLCLCDERNKIKSHLHIF